MRALREKHDLRHKGKRMQLKEGDVVLIKGEEKNRVKWKIGVATDLIPGREGVVRTVRLRAGKNYLERLIQFLYPLELHCDVKKRVEFTPEAREWQRWKERKAFKEYFRMKITVK